MCLYWTQIPNTLNNSTVSESCTVADTRKGQILQLVGVPITPSLCLLSLALQSSPQGGGPGLPGVGHHRETGQEIQPVHQLPHLPVVKQGMPSSLRISLFNLTKAPLAHA